MRFWTHGNHVKSVYKPWPIKPHSQTYKKKITSNSRIAALRPAISFWMWANAVLNNSIALSSSLLISSLWRIRCAWRWSNLSLRRTYVAIPQRSSVSASVWSLPLIYKAKNYQSVPLSFFFLRFMNSLLLPPMLYPCPYYCPWPPAHNWIAICPALVRKYYQKKSQKKNMTTT